MAEAEKSTIRAEFAKELIEAEMDQKTLEKYLQSDMTKSPIEFNEEFGVDKDMKEFLEEEFPSQ